MIKYTRTEGNAEVVSKDAHAAIQAELHRHAKTSVKDLTDEQRAELTKISLAQSQLTR